MQNKQSLLLRNQTPKNVPSRSRKAKEGWQKDDLENLLGILIDHRGITPKKLGGDWSVNGIPALSAKNIKAGRIVNEQDIRFVNQKLYEKWMPEKLEDEDILLTSEAPLGELYFLKEKKDYVLSQRLFALRTNRKKLNSRYLYYYLQGSIGRQELMRRLSGTAAEGIRQAELRKIKVEFPEDILEQEKIASVLSAFDDKIEVNNKIAKTLEEMAQVLFKEWFVNNKRDDWEEKKLGQILTLKHGFAFKSEQFTTNKTKNVVVRMGNFQETGGLQFSDNTFYLTDIKGYEKYILKPGDIVMIFSDITREGRLIGNVGLIPNDENVYVLNQRVAKIDYDEIYKYFLLSLFNSTVFHQHCLARADSATVLNLKNEHISEYQIADPGKDILDKFNKATSPIFKKLESIKKENQKLAALRNLLLPRLMKGEIRI